MALTEKQKRFADEYLIDLNATRAYKAAYPKVKKEETAAAAGARLLKNVNVATYVEKRIKDRKKRTEITQDLVLMELVEIATARAADYSDSNLKYANKIKALELLGRHLGMWNDRMQISSNLDVEKSKLDDLISQMRGGSG